MTWNVPVTWFPALSVAVAVTVVVPIENVDPEAGEYVSVARPDVTSVALAAVPLVLLNVTVAPAGLVGNVAVLSDGRVSVGGVESYFIVVVAVPVFPALSMQCPASGADELSGPE